MTFHIDPGTGSMLFTILIRKRAELRGAGDETAAGESPKEFS